MAALALIFAIQIMIRAHSTTSMKSTKTWMQLMQRELQKCVEKEEESTILDGDSKEGSLRLADHHIGITHGGDGCSRRIVDFDRERAIKLSEIESAKDNPLDERISAIALENSKMHRQICLQSQSHFRRQRVWVVC